MPLVQSKTTAGSLEEGLTLAYAEKTLLQTESRTVKDEYSVAVLKAFHQPYQALLSSVTAASCHAFAVSCLPCSLSKFSMLPC